MAIATQRVLLYRIILLGGSNDLFLARKFSLSLNHKKGNTIQVD